MPLPEDSMEGSKIQENRHTAHILFLFGRNKCLNQQPARQAQGKQELSCIILLNTLKSLPSYLTIKLK